MKLFSYQTRAAMLLSERHPEKVANTADDSLMMMVRQLDQFMLAQVQSKIILPTPTMSEKEHREYFARHSRIRNHRADPEVRYGELWINLECLGRVWSINVGKLCPYRFTCPYCRHAFSGRWVKTDR